jgi:hypothetical protein
LRVLRAWALCALVPLLVPQQQDPLALPLQAVVLLLRMVRRSSSAHDRGGWRMGVLPTWK